MRTIQVGFLGCGNIGSGVWRLLHQMEEALEAREAVRFHVKRMLVRNVNRPRNASIPFECLTTRPEDVLEDPEITLVVEVLGGEQPAAAYMGRALEAGKTVVTANKLALAMHWDELMQSAQRGQAGLYFEASVCGALPIIRTLTDSLQANKISQLFGIINGTTNYILSRMTAEGSAYSDVLFDAQRLGLAEPDPTADVEGGDAACKLSILSTLAFRAPVTLPSIFRQGITTITPLDITYGMQLGYALKLLAIAKRKGYTVQARVHPTFVPVTHPLASVSDAFNAVYLRGHACGDMMLYGRGAGDNPTASAVVSDMIAAAKQSQPPIYRTTGEVSMDEDWESRYFIRMAAVDRPGVLGSIAGILGRHGVSIASMRQTQGMDRVPLLFVTHVAREKAVRAALEEIDERLATIENVIYVEDMEGENK